MRSNRGASSSRRTRCMCRIWTCRFATDPIAVGGSPDRRSVRILQRLPAAQRTQAAAIEPHVFLYLSVVNPGVLAERPADRLLQEEFLRTKRGLDAGVQ